MKTIPLGILWIVMVVCVQGCVQQVLIIPTVVPHESITERPIVLSPTTPATESFTPTASYINVSSG
jgi:hypothetical protein